MNFENKIVVLTGGASGIGRATTLEFARRGATVYCGDINSELGSALAADAKDLPGAVDFQPLDVTDDASIAAIGELVHARHGKADILVNVAGWDRSEPFMQNSPEYMQKVVDINLYGPMKMVKTFLPAMVEAEQGKIVSVSSDAGRVGSMNETVYAGAKGGIIAFSKSLAREVARYKINVNVVCPGPTETPLFRSQPERLQDALVRAIPFRRPALPEEIGYAILFFASELTDYVTGQVLSVSGGLTMVD